MLTIFTIPKSFDGHINIIQRNAIQSWLQIRPKPEIILFGGEEGIDETAKEFNIQRVSEIKKNEFGTPLLNWAFNFTQKLARNDTLVYVNADIILMSDFISAIQQIKTPLFLMAGRRWDLDVKEEINFENYNWGKELLERIKKEGKLHGFSGIDYFVFPRNLPHDLPLFAVGRPGWDNWLIWHIRSLKIPVIDATEVITVIHQNHDFSHSLWGNEKKKKVKGPEAQSALQLAGGFSNMLTLREADWILKPQGLRKPDLPRRIFTFLSSFGLWRVLLSIKRKLQEL